MSANGLQTYNQKRDFNITPEPPGDAVRPDAENLQFVVQKHDARRLHYDFRLEIGGVLVSWAVPKGPSYYPKEKRLAVRTEDHPLSYGDFEGIIPEKQYGAGPVMLWDKGRWIPLDKDPAKALAKGKLTFRLEGEKLRGQWTLARMGKQDGGRENWLLIKNTDDEAAVGENEDFLEKTDYSVKTGLEFEDIVAGKTQKVPIREPNFSELEKKYNGVQLATLVDSPPERKNWVHEVKYDGYRILAFVRNGEVRIRTRRGHNWTDKFPVLVAALQQVKNESFVIDGEAVVLDENGLTSFKQLQNSLGDQRAPMQAYFFDLLYHNGEDYSGRPFRERRAALERLFVKIPKDPLFLSETLEGQADLIIGKACDLGLEGIISKNTEATYTPTRTKSWLKSKCEQRQEFVICGFVPSTDIPRAIGSLHLGYHKDGKLTYAGKVGTGFDTKTAEDLFTRLKALERKSHPFPAKPSARMSDTIWVEPEVLCEVKFGMWTQTGKIRHASYQGLREDKRPQEITREEPEKLTKAVAKTRPRGPKDKRTVCGVTISNPGREIFPESKITKGELAEFYGAMADLIMPNIINRPVSLVRCPGGIDRQCFFQRSKGKGMPEDIYRIDVTHDGKAHDYLYVKKASGLLGLVQMGSIEIHPWGVKIDDLYKPDRIIFDLDPDEDVPFEAVKLAAQDVKRRLDALELTSFLKTTGGKGLHVTIPIIRRHNWDTVKDFARNIARQMAKSVPEAYTTNMAKKKRKGRIFIDYLRNDFASTAVMDYCVRARPGAAIAVPLHWDELAGLKSPDQFHFDDVLARRQSALELLEQYNNTRQNLTKAHLQE